jgi:hypothetical protein
MANVSNSQTLPSAAEFHPTSLSIEQENVIDQLVLGASEREAAETCGVDRGTIARWRQSSPLFVATLNTRRQALWGAAQERLRALILTAIGQLEARMESMTTKEVLMLVAQHAHVPAPTGETEAGDVALLMLDKQLKAEGVHANNTLERLSEQLMPTSPADTKRRAEILRELAGDKAS